MKRSRAFRRPYPAKASTPRNNPNRIAISSPSTKFSCRSVGFDKLSQRTLAELAEASPQRTLAELAEASPQQTLAELVEASMDT